MQPRPTRNPACSSRICSSRFGDNLRSTTDAKIFEAVGIRVMPRWLEQMLRQPFLKIGTTIDSPQDGGILSSHQTLENRMVSSLTTHSPPSLKSAGDRSSEPAALWRFRTCGSPLLWVVLLLQTKEQVQMAPRSMLVQKAS